MKSALAIAITFLLAVIVVQFRLHDLAKERSAPVPSLRLNVNPNATASINFVVPQNSVYEVELVIDRDSKNRMRECEFGLSNVSTCTNKNSIINLDIKLFEDNKIINETSVRGYNQISSWGSSLGSILTTFNGNKSSKYKISVQTHESLANLDSLNPRVQVSLNHRLAKNAFVKASILSLLSIALIIATFVSFLIVALLSYKKKTINA